MNGAASSVFDKYRNRDTRCGYPFSPDPCGYCWSYAHHVDGTKGYEDMEKICRGCDLFSPNAPREGRRSRTLDGVVGGEVGS